MEEIREQTPSMASSQREEEALKDTETAPKDTQTKQNGNTTKAEERKERKAKPPNPYLNTDLTAIRLLKRQNRRSLRKVTIRPRATQIEAVEDRTEATGSLADPQNEVTSEVDHKDEQEKQDHQQQRVRRTPTNESLPRTPRGAQSGTGGGDTDRQSALPPVEPRGMTQRYFSASIRSLYLPDEDRKRRSKGSAGTRKSNQLVHEVGGGSLLTYTGVQRLRKESLDESTQRLAHYTPGTVPNSRRVTQPEVTLKCGLTASFQWTAGGQRCHGFMW